jgi:flagellar M-ring protein FliF
MQRIENILIPLVGREGIQAQVTAEVDFTVTERTQEMFYPDSPALRREQVEGGKNSLSVIEGVPGAMFNQPITTAGVAPTNKVATRHYELDKTLTHTRLATGVVRRLSVAVVIDYKKIADNGYQVTPHPYPQIDMNQFKSLVMQAVGFDNDRGDLVTVSNVAFRMPEMIDALPELVWWKQEASVQLAKQVAAGLIVLLLLVGVMWPIVRRLKARDEEAQILLEAHAKAKAIGGVVQMNDEGKPIAVSMSALHKEPDDLLLLETPESYKKRLDYVQKLIDENPLQVSQILSGWLKSNG